MWFKNASKWDVLSLVVSAVIWGLVLYIMVDLIQEFWSSGRKEKTTIKQEVLENLDSPWLSIISEVGPNCRWAEKHCSFQSMRRDPATGGLVRGNFDCRSCFENTTFYVVDQPFPTILFNASRFRELGYEMKSQLDQIEMALAVVDNVSGEIVTNMSQCFTDPRQETGSAIVVPVGDRTRVTTLQSGGTTLQDFSAPIYLAYNHYAPISFELSQTEFADGRIVNTTRFSATQYSILPRLRYKADATVISASFFPSSFSVQRIVHANGETILGLLGGMFGWIGVWTGACVQGLIMSTLAAYRARQKCAAMAEQGETLLEMDPQYAITDVTHRMESVEEELSALKKRIFVL